MPGIWPGFLALEQRTGGQILALEKTAGGGGGEYSFTGLLGRRNTVLQFYRDPEDHVLKIPYYIKIPIF